MGAAAVYDDTFTFQEELCADDLCNPQVLIAERMGYGVDMDGSSKGEEGRVMV